jgi:hypothetical protein
LILKNGKTRLFGGIAGDSAGVPLLRFPGKGNREKPPAWFGPLSLFAVSKQRVLERIFLWRSQD